MGKITSLKQKNYFLVLCTFLLSFNAVSQTNPSIYLSSSTFTVPAGVHQVTVEAWGAGGKGGTCLSQNGLNVGGGGGGGAYSAKSIPVVPGTTYTVQVGLGSTTITDGQDSWFGTTTTILAKGGKSCPDNVKVGAAGGSASQCIGDLTSSGGNGANGIDNVSGGGGGAGAEAGDAGVSPSANNYLGAIGSCSGGNGGDAYTAQNGDGFPGQSPGGGGGGGKRNNNNGVNIGWGGSGGNGKIIVRWGNSSPLPSLTYGPGGVTSDLQLWLRSDLLDGTTNTADNSNVSTWITQGRGSNATKPSAVQAPVFRNNAASNINFNPVVDFTNDYNTAAQVFTNIDPTRQYLTGPTGFYSMEIFVVVMPDVPVTSSLKSMDVFCGDRLPCEEIDKTGVGYGNFTSRFSNEIVTYCFGTEDKYGAAQVSSSLQYNNVGIINSRNNGPNSGMTLFYNGATIGNTEVNSSTYRNVYDSRFWIGRSEGWDGSLDGRVAEIITFSSRTNNATTRRRIESYLAIKYGITLGTIGVPQNYIASNGSIIWNAASNTGFNRNVAGIGRDDVSKLNQKQSKSVNTGVFLTIGLGTISPVNTANTNTFDSDAKYLIWGENGAGMNTAINPVTVNFAASTTTTTHVAYKQWKIVETGGDVSEVKVAIPLSALSQLPALTGNDAYVMVVASDFLYTTDVETIFLDVNGANLETLYDFDGTKFFTFGVAREIVLPRHTTLNGSNNIIKAGNAINLTGNFSMMMWVRPDGTNALSNDRTILSKHNGTTGYKVILLPNNKIQVNWSGGTTLISNTIIQNYFWSNIAVIYDGVNVRLYIDGVLDAAIVSAIPATNTNIFSIGAEYRSKNDVRNYFKGDIDEVRIWNSTLTLTQIRFVMNQEILSNGLATKGTIIPTSITKNDINSVAWNNLIAYFSMNSFIGTYVNDDSIRTNRGSLTVPEKIVITVPSAPMPFVSAANGDWYTAATWSNGNVLNLPYRISQVDNITTIDWNIVVTSHNIESTGNKTLLGLLVNANTVKAENNTKIEVSHYLKLNGKIDLSGRSQLVQTIGSDLDATSSGFIEKDQQGHSNRFNYNYWSSPVGAINAITNNNSYTVGSVLRDGTNPANPQNIIWTTGLNSSATSPITLSSYWIFKFQNVTNNYANWSAVNATGSLLAGQGFTLKGSNAATASQNYTFIGKPNNHLVSTTIAANNLNLSGNPYASAIDANAFISENISAISGSLYFWEHYSTNSAHTLIYYQGGYAVRNLVGGTPPISPAGISGMGSSSKTPKRFIPVGQGFFIVGSTSGGTVRFSNSQRSFVKEDNTNSNTMFRLDPHLNTAMYPANNNTDDAVAPDEFYKIRLGFTSSDNYHRQVLLGFMNEMATDAIDPGYDALHIDNQPSDMYFLKGGAAVNIMGEGFFNVNNIYPIGIKNSVPGTIRFMLDEIENIPAGLSIYIHDAVTNSNHDITSQEFVIDMPSGTVNDRFSLRFTASDSFLGTNNVSFEDGIQVIFTNADNVLNIKFDGEKTIKTVTLYNILGQSISMWNVENQSTGHIRIPVTHLSSGTYIVKLATSAGNFAKKITIK